MGLFTPKRATPDTPGATSGPPPRESRAARRERQQHEARRTAMDESWRNARRASSERDAQFWEAYERRHGTGSVDYS